MLLIYQFISIYIQSFDRRYDITIGISSLFSFVQLEKVSRDSFSFLRICFMIFMSVVVCFILVVSPLFELVFKVPGVFCCLVVVYFIFVVNPLFELVFKGPGVFCCLVVVYFIFVVNPLFELAFKGPGVFCCLAFLFLLLFELSVLAKVLILFK